ncbi:hypothetical protein Tco_1199929 [Tanacetum coccineum]
MLSNGGVIVVEDDHDVIHDNNSSDLALSTSLNDLDFMTLNIDGQSMDVETPPDIIGVDDDDDFIDGEDEVPYDLADFDDEVLASDDDDGVAIIMSATLARGQGGDSGSDGPSRPHPHPIDIDSEGGKNNHRKKRSIVTGTSLMSESDGTFNDATPRVDVAKEVVSSSMVDDSVEMEKLSPVFIRNNLLILRKWHPDENLLKEDVSTIPVWVKLHGVPVTAFSEDGLSAIATKLGTPLMLDSYTVDMCMQSWGRSSYAKAMIELRADVELKYNIVTAMPKITREGCRISKIITQ